MRNEKFDVWQGKYIFLDYLVASPGAMRSSRPTKHLIANRTF